MKPNNEIIKIKDLSKLVSFLCIVKHIFTINASLLQKLKNKISPHTFLMETIPPVFHEMQLAVFESGNAYYSKTPFIATPSNQMPPVYRKNRGVPISSPPA